MATSTGPSLSIFFPCYNDAGTIGGLIRKATQTARKLTPDFEIIVIDDGSTDGSRKVLETYRRRFRKLKVMLHQKNRGYGGVLKTGFGAAQKDWVFYTDGDAQYDVGELPMLWSLMTGDVNLVNGIKMERSDYSHRVIVGNLYALMVRWMFLLTTYDVDCDFRLLKRGLIKKIKLTSSSGAVCVELIKRAQLAGAKIRQVSVHHYPRRYGKSQFFRPKRLLHTAIELTALWWNLMIRHGRA